MDKWLLIISTIVIISIIIALLIGQAYESAKLKKLEESLIQCASKPKTNIVDFDSFSELPPPVSRYFKHVLVDGQKLIRTARIRQSGVLRTSAMNTKWSAFTAQQLIVTALTSFIWNAKVEMPFATHVRVLDSYAMGVGSGRVSLFSAFAIASESGLRELNLGALHRYLAESVWFPTTLLPQSGVIWSPINDHSAMATITDRGITVSLEFQFNKIGEVIGIYSPGRFGNFDGGYKQVPWEGHFRDYQIRSGMRIPLYGEVGWYVDETLELVWKGSLIGVHYEME